MAELDVRSRLVAPCAMRVFPGDDTLFDLGAFLRRVFLFEHYIIKSVRLREIPYLVKVFGLAGFFQLLDSQIITFDCDPSAIGETNQPGRIGLCTRSEPLKGTEYAFFRVSPSNSREFLSGCFREFLHSPQLSSLSRADLKKLKLATLDSIVVDRGDQGVQALKQFRNDVLTQNHLVACSIADQLHRFGKHPPEVGKVEAVVHATDSDLYNLETNVGAGWHLSPDELREIGKKALFAVANMNLRIEEMKHYNAMSGFIPDESFLFGKKAELLTFQGESNSEDRRFERILTISNLPQPDFNQTDIRIDVDKLLKARVSPECSQFREWLRTSDDYTDDQIHQMVRGLKARFAEFVHAPFGKAVRILLAAGLGATPAHSAVLGALDMFLLERLLPRSGPVTFLSRLYPSIFKQITE